MATSSFVDAADAASYRMLQGVCSFQKTTSATDSSLQQTSPVRAGSGHQRQARSLSWSDVVKGDWTVLCLVLVFFRLCLAFFRQGHFDDYFVFFLFRVTSLVWSSLVVTVPLQYDWKDSSPKFVRSFVRPSVRPSVPPSIRLSMHSFIHLLIRIKQQCCPE